MADWLSRQSAIYSLAANGHQGQEKGKYKKSAKKENKAMSYRTT